MGVHGLLDWSGELRRRIRAPRRPHRPPPHVHHRYGAVRAGIGAVRDRAVARAAHRSTTGSGFRPRHLHARVARAHPRRVARGPAHRRHRRVDHRGRDRLGHRAHARRSDRAELELARRVRGQRDDRRADAMARIPPRGRHREARRRTAARSIGHRAAVGLARVPRADDRAGSHVGMDRSEDSWFGDTRGGAHRAVCPPVEGSPGARARREPAARPHLSAVAGGLDARDRSDERQPRDAAPVLGRRVALHEAARRHCGVAAAGAGLSWSVRDLRSQPTATGIAMRSCSARR